MLHGGTTNLNPTYWHLKHTKFFYSIPEDQTICNILVSRYKSYTLGRVLSDEQPPLQEDAVNEVYLRKLQMISYLLIHTTRDMKNFQTMQQTKPTKMNLKKMMKWMMFLMTSDRVWLCYSVCVLLYYIKLFVLHYK